MADTGILIRGDLFNNIFIDGPVTREIVMAGSWLGAGTDNGTGGTDVHYLNLAALAMIGKLEDDQGAGTIGFKTSELPITYDGGLFEKSTDPLVQGIIVDVNNILYYEALGFKKVTSSELTFLDDSVLNLNYYKFLTYKPDVTFTALDVTVTWSAGAKAAIFNESTSTPLGYATISGQAYTFPVAPQVGDVISISMIDAEFNAGKKQTITI